LENRKLLKTIFKITETENFSFIRDIKCNKNAFVVQIVNEMNKYSDILIYEKDLKVDFFIFV
jgi:hypothetical protein